MKIEKKVNGRIGYSPWLLTLWICTLLSPVLPGLALLAIAIIVVWRDKEAAFERDFAGLIFLALMGVAAVSTLVQQTAWGFLSIAFFLVYYVVYGWLKREVGPDRFHDGLLVGSVSGVGIVLVMLIDRAGGFAFVPTVLEYFFGTISWKPTDSLRSTGTSGNANLAVSLTVCLALVCTYKLIHPNTVWPKRILWAGLLTLYGVGFELTETRMAWIALGAGVAVQLWCLYGDRLRQAFGRFRYASVTVLLATPSGLMFLLDEWLPRAASLGEDMLLRLQIWERSLAIFSDHWLFGVLPLHFGEVFQSMFGVYEYHAHNLLIGIAVDFGLIGFTLFALLLVSSLMRGWQWIQFADNRKERDLSVIMMSLVFAFIGQNVVDYTVMFPQTGWIFFMSLAYMHMRGKQVAPVMPLESAHRPVRRLSGTPHPTFKL